MRQGAQGQCTGMTLRDGIEREVGGGSERGTRVHPWLIHVNVWQKPLQYCKVISLQLKKIIFLKETLKSKTVCELRTSRCSSWIRKGRGTRDQITNIQRVIEKAREFQKNIYFCFIDYVKAFDCVDHNKLRESLKEMGLPDHLTSLLRNLYADQESTVRTGHGTTDWLQTGKGVHQGCILSSCLFNL